MFSWKLVQVAESDSVIIMTHEPNWLLDWYWNETSGKNVAHLIRDHLNGRCKLRMAGDLHHYMRHSYVPSDRPVYVHHLLVNGCGGAFLHPTHVFRGFRKFYGTSYEMKAAYPSCEDSSNVRLKNFLHSSCVALLALIFLPCYDLKSSIPLQIALGNILKFRKKNWQFDFIGGIIYFVLAFSMFPQVTILLSCFCVRSLMD